MKKILTLSFIILLFINQQLKANPITSLTIEMPTPTEVTLWIDGVNFGSFRNSITLDQLYTGTHEMKILGSRRHLNRYQPTPIIYCGQVETRYNTKTIAQLLHGYGIRISYLPLYNQVCYQTPYQSSCHPNHHASPTCNNYPPPTTIPVIYPVSEQAFCQFKQVLANTWFDSDKKALICNFLQMNFVTTQQAYQLINQLDFEQTRLAIAKEAYLKTVDRQNYYSVFCLFDFESSKKCLSEYMASV